MGRGVKFGGSRGPKWRLDPFWGPFLTNFDSPPYFTPTLGGTDQLGAFALHPNDQKGSKKAQKGPKLLKMTKNGPKRGSRRHLTSGPTNFDSPPHFTPTLGGPGPLGAFAPHPNGQIGSKRAQNGSKLPKMASKAGLDATWALGTHQF